MWDLLLVQVLLFLLRGNAETNKWVPAHHLPTVRCLQIVYEQQLTFELFELNSCARLSQLIVTFCNRHHCVYFQRYTDDCTGTSPFGSWVLGVLVVITQLNMPSHLWWEVWLLAWPPYKFKTCNLLSEGCKGSNQYGKGCNITNATRPFNSSTRAIKSI